jgi:integrase
VRLSEARLATWQEINREKTVWTPPWQHLKMGRKHKRSRPIPIPPRMRAILDEMERRRTDPPDDAAPIFPSPYGGGPHSQLTCSQFLRDTLKWDELVRCPDGSMRHITLHGFRSTLRDWCRANCYEELLWKFQADHVSGDKSDQSYGPDRLLERRRQMMEAWGEFCTRPTPAAGANITQLNEAREQRRAS